MSQNLILFGFQDDSSMWIIIGVVLVLLFFVVCNCRNRSGDFLRYAEAKEGAGRRRFFRAAKRASSRRACGCLL